MDRQSDDRWVYSFVKFNKVYKKLDLFLEKKTFTEIEEQGVIKAFEYTFDFAWKTLQNLLKTFEFSSVSELKELIEKSCELGYISDYTGWRKMADARNITQFTYDELNAEALVEDIRNTYFLLFQNLRESLFAYKKSNLSN